MTETNSKKPLKPSRKHHFVSQFYLKGFGKASKKNKTNIYSFEKQTLTRTLTTTNAICTQNDYFTVENSEYPLDYFEKQIAAFEGKVAIVLKKLQDGNKIQDDKELGALLEFIAYLDAFSPRTRKEMEEKLSLEIEKRKTEDRKFYYREPDNFGHIDGAMDCKNKIFEALQKRSWVLAETSKSIGYFITSDRPVVLEFTVSSNDKCVLKDHYSKNTYLIFPLMKEFCLLGGVAEGQKDIKKIISKRELVASVNGYIWDAAEKYVYSYNDNFIYFKDDETICNLIEL